MSIRSEDDILALVGAFLPMEHESLLLGPGDDCAVLRAGGPWAVTCDVFAEDVHFRRRYFSAAEVGHKALAVNLSDVASSGARAAGFVTGLTLTGRESEAWLRGFAAGMGELARRYGVAAAGGDLARGAQLNVCVTAWGELEAPGRDLRRGRVRAGDILFAVGPLGLARVGLAVLEAAKPRPAGEEATLACESAAGEVFSPAVTAARREWPAACAAHVRPEPLLDHGRTLVRLSADRPDRFSLMDVSDGLARDLPRLLASGRTGLGADLDLPDLALPDEVRRYAALHGEDAPAFAFAGGEDYALLGSCPPERWNEVEAALSAVPAPCPTLPAGSLSVPPQAYRVRRLGVARPGPVFLNGRAAAVEGFDHFAPRKD